MHADQSKRADTDAVLDALLQSVDEPIAMVCEVLLELERLAIRALRGLLL